MSLALLLSGLTRDDFNAASSRHILEIVLPLAAVSLIASTPTEHYWAREPVSPVDLLAKRIVSGACLASAFISMSIYTVMFHVPLYFQLRGNNTGETGIRLSPESIGAVLGFTAGIIMRRTGRYDILKTFAFTWHGMQASPQFPWVILRHARDYLFLNGLGLCGIFTVMLLTLLSSVKHEHQPVTTSIQYAFRSTGATLGIALSSVVVRRLLKSRFGDALGFGIDMIFSADPIALTGKPMLIVQI